MTALYESSIESLPLVSKGKVRDLYALGHDLLLMIATDRLSAFDVIMNEPVPDKGAILTRISNYWFLQLASIEPNHLTTIDARSVVKASEIIQVERRAVVVKRLKPVLIKAVVRGYLAGSAWKEYQSMGNECQPILEWLKNYRSLSLRQHQRSQAARTMRISRMQN